MLEEFATVNKLHADAKLHRSLLVRLWIFGGIGFSLAALALYDAISADFFLTIPIAMFFVGLPIGFYLLSRMLTVEWNENRELVAARKFDRAGFAILALYIAFEFLSHRFITDSFADVHQASAVTFALLSGIILGRFFGSMTTIHEAHAARRRRR